MFAAFKLEPLLAFGTLEFAIVGVIFVLLFGHRLPSIARSMGQGITEFKKGVNGIEDDKDADVPQKAK